MIIYTQQGQFVNLQMKVEDFHELVSILVMATTNVVRSPAARRQILDFANRVNETNAQWTPYKLPASK